MAQMSAASERLKSVARSSEVQTNTGEDIGTRPANHGKTPAPCDGSGVSNSDAIVAMHAARATTEIRNYLISTGTILTPSFGRAAAGSATGLTLRSTMNCWVTVTSIGVSRI